MQLLKKHGWTEGMGLGASEQVCNRQSFLLYYLLGLEYEIIVEELKFERINLIFDLNKDKDLSISKDINLSISHLRLRDRLQVKKHPAPMDFQTFYISS